MTSPNSLITPTVAPDLSLPNCKVRPDQLVETFIQTLQLPADQFPADKVVTLKLQFTTTLSAAELEVTRR